MIRHNKLVRDKIVEIIESRGQQATWHTADDTEYKQKLHEKLVEEAQEFLADGTPKELIDVMAVVDAIIACHGFDQAELNRLQAAKESERGGFERRIILEESEES
jgi:predicted house-cleaning noncanonical NTP pyrophosphatase (MazG superfamily)